MSESVMQSVLGGSVVLIISMIGYYIKALTDRVEKIAERISIVQDSQTEIETNYLQRFQNVNDNLHSLSRRFEERFDELKGVLDNHFLLKHTEVVNDIKTVERFLEDIQKQFKVYVHRLESLEGEFKSEYLPVILYAKQQMEAKQKRSKKDVQ